MDKELLNAFNNLSVALQNLADNLEKNAERTEKSESMIADSLSKFDVTEQIKSIDEGIKKIAQSNAEIIDQQKNILEALSKKEPKKPADTEKVGVQKKLTDMVQKIFKKQQDDSKKIQTTNDAVTKQKKTSPEYVPDKEQKKKITDGVKMILLMAAGILAIGIAFKIIGKVNFLSVIALALALPLVAIAFKKVAEMRIDTKFLLINLAGLIVFSAAMVAASYFFSRMRTITVGQALTTIMIAGAFAALSFSLGRLTKSIKNVDLKGLFLMPLVLVTASLAIMASSYILGGVRTITIGQAFTTILISIAFAALSLSIGKLTKSLKNVDLRGLIMMPLVLITASIAIAASSYILAAVRPVGFFQLLTSIAIAATFAVIGFGIGKILQGTKGVRPDQLVKLPLVLIAASAAILGSSFLLSGVKLISFRQFLTSIGIALVFIPISIALPFIAKAVKVVDIGKAALMPIVLVSMALAITLASKVFSEASVIAPGKLFNLVLQGITIAVVGVVMGLAYFALQKMGLASPSGIKTVIFGSIAILGIATTIMLTSKILSFGDYDKYPSLMWTLGSVASILAYGILIAVAGTALVATGGLGALGIIAGALAIIAIAGTILAVDKILSKGTYTTAPSLSYAASVSLMMVTFGAVMAASALLYPLMLIGSKSVGLIAESIKDSSEILSKGVYTGGPTEDWAKGVSLAIAAFAPVIGSFGVGGFLDSLFGISTDDASKSIRMISEAIVSSANVFAGAGGNWVMGPPVAWSESVGKAIAAFAPVFDKLDSSGIFAIFDFAKVAVMTDSIVAVTTGIIASAALFEIAGTAISYKSYPSLAWSEGVSKAIGAFAPVFDKLNSSGLFAIFDAVKVATMTAAIVATTTGIITSAGLFALAGLKYTNYPKAEWSDGVSKAIQAFSPAMEWAAENSGWFSSGADDLIDVILGMGTAITGVSLILQLGKFNVSIEPNYFPTLKEAYMSHFEFIAKAKEYNIGLTDIGVLLLIAVAIKDVSLEISKGKYDTIIPPEYGKSLIQAFNDFDTITKIVDRISLANSYFAVLVSESIAKVSRIIDTGIYTTIIPSDYGKNLASLFMGYKDVVDVVKSITPGFFSTVLTKAGDALDSIFGIEREKITPETVAMNIVSLSKILSMGRYVKIPMDWMQSVYENMKQYMNVVDLMSGYRGEFEIFGISLSFGKGISRLTSDYDRLAQSIQSVATAVSNLDIDKMNTMRAMTGSVVLLSLMDPGQFESMMDALEEKSSVLGNIFSKLETGAPVQSAMPAVRTAGVGVAGTTAEGGMDEVIKIMKSMAMSLGQISSNSTNISNYVNQLRTSGKGPSLGKDS